MKFTAYFIDDLVGSLVVAASAVAGYIIEPNALESYMMETASA